MQESVGVSHGGASSQTPKRRAGVIGDPKATIFGGRVQRFHVDVNEARQRLEWP